MLISTEHSLIPNFNFFVTINYIKTDFTKNLLINMLWKIIKLRCSLENISWVSDFQYFSKN